MPRVKVKKAEVYGSLENLVRSLDSAMMDARVLKADQRYIKTVNLQSLEAALLSYKGQLIDAQEQVGEDFTEADIREADNYIV